MTHTHYCAHARTFGVIARVLAVILAFAFFSCGGGKLTAPTVVNLAAIAGVTPPRTGETPVAAIVPTEQYTGAVAWAPSHALFAASTTYTATITLATKAGYTLQGVAANFFTVAGASTVSNSAGSGVIVATFPPTGASDVQQDLSGAITITPDSAAVGDELTAHYSGTESVAYQWNMEGTGIPGAIGQTHQPLVVGNYTVTVSAEGYHSKTSSPVAVAPNLEDTVEYLAIHKQDTLAPPNPPDPNRWYVEDPESFTRGWDEILDPAKPGSIGTKGTPTRRLALAYWFSYFRHPMEKTKASILNMMHAAEEREVPIYIHLDGTAYWRNTGLWNWWNNVNDNEALLRDDPGARYDPENIKNVGRYGWDMDTATKISWRDWGEQHRVEYRNGMAVPAPNQASPAFRQKNAEALGEIMPIIVKWYNDLPANKKYLLAGVVLGAELSVDMNASYFRNKPGFEPGTGAIYDGNDFWNKGNEETYKAIDADAGLTLSGGITTRLGYAAAQTLGIQTTGQLTGETIDRTLNDYINFMIDEALKSGIPAKKLITHAYPPPRPDTWYQSTYWMDRVNMGDHFTKDGVVAGWTCPIMNYEDGIKLEKLHGRSWAAIETHFWAVLNMPHDEQVEYINNVLPGRLAGMFGYGGCRHVNIKNWEFPLIQSEGFRNAIKAALSQ